MDLGIGMGRMFGHCRRGREDQREEVVCIHTSLWVHCFRWPPLMIYWEKVPSALKVAFHCFSPRFHYWWFWTFLFSLFSFLKALPWVSLPTILNLFIPLLFLYFHLFPQVLPWPLTSPVATAMLPCCQLLIGWFSQTCDQLFYVFLPLSSLVVLSGSLEGLADLEPLIHLFPSRLVGVWVNWMTNSTRWVRLLFSNSLILINLLK